MFLGAHSVMGPNVVRPALESAGGLLLLGSQALPAVSDTFPAFATWSATPPFSHRQRRTHARNT